MAKQIPRIAAKRKRNAERYKQMRLTKKANWQKLADVRLGAIKAYNKEHFGVDGLLWDEDQMVARIKRRARKVQVGSITGNPNREYKWGDRTYVNTGSSLPLPEAEG